jgi:hypothetical protein
MKKIIILITFCFSILVVHAQQKDIVGAWIQTDKFGTPLFWDCEDASHPGAIFYTVFVFTNQGIYLERMVSGDIISNVLDVKFVSTDCNGILYQHPYEFYSGSRLLLHLPNVLKGGEDIIEHKVQFLSADKIYLWGNYYKRLDGVVEPY